MENKPQFRADIEGLRGVAIFLVLLFHAQIPGFTGGFFGVDIFYVISGYLITGLLIRERESAGKISLKVFYARRIRRLLPVATVVLIATLIASYFLAPRLLMPAIAFDIASAALFLSNMNFAHHATDYFANSTPSPVLHFWSLSVEEQYYMLWPALAILFTRRAKSVTLRIFFSMLVLGSLSFWFAIWLLNENQSWAFFSLPSRAWELALGGLLASSKLWIDKIPKTWFVFIQWLGVLLLIGSAMILRQTDKFPGVPALFPTVATALLLLGGTYYASEDGKFTLAKLPNKVLGSVPLRYLGKISYSLYLWHWPVLIIVAYHYKDGLTLTQRFALVIISILLSIFTYHLVENPLRHGKFVGNNSTKNIATALAVISIVAGSSLFISAHLNSVANKKVVHVISKPKPKPILPVRPATVDYPLPADLAPNLLVAGNDRPITYDDRCHTQQNLTPSTRACLYGDLKGNKTIVLFGDSHALAWFPAVNELAKKNHWKLLSLTMSACTPADIPAWDRTSAKVMQNCTLWRKQSIARILAKKPYAILVTGTRGFVTIDANKKILDGAEATSIWEAGMSRTLAKLKTASSNVFMIMDAPLSIYDPKVCLSENPKSTLVCATPLTKALSSSWQVVENKVATVNKVKIIDPSYWICPSTPCPVIVDDILVDLDAGHMTATFATSLAPDLNATLLNKFKLTPGVDPKPKPSLNESGTSKVKITP